MVIYKCIRCGYTSNYKNNMKTHINRKKLCESIIENIPRQQLKLIFSKNIEKFIYEGFLEKKKEKEYKCQYCSNIFTTSSNLNKHNRICKFREDKEDKIIDFIKNQTKKYEKHIKMLEIREKEREEKWEKRELLLKNEISKLLEKVEKPNITNIQNQNNIFINNHGNENLDYINSTVINNLINIPYGALPKLVKYIHFNPEHPENQNIKITNKKLPYASVYKDSKWILTDKKEVIDNMLNKGFNMLEYHYVNKEEKDNKYENFKTQYEDGDIKLKKQLNKDVELTIINESVTK